MPPERLHRFRVGLRSDQKRFSWSRFIFHSYPQCSRSALLRIVPFVVRGPPQVKPGPATHSAIKRAFCSKVAHLLPQTWTDKRGYSEGVRYDTSTPRYDGPAFKCTSYEHSVTAVDFNSPNGDCRTQAAAVINQHPAFLRLRTPAPTT
jgi:hypothetical protein